MTRMGPRTDPWGTPQVTVWGFEVEWPMKMYSVRFVRYEWNQLRAVSVSPVVEWSRFNKMAWSTGSNAADRSRRMRREGEPESDDIRRSFVTFTRAVSVLLAGRKTRLEFFIDVIEF